MKSKRNLIAALVLAAAAAPAFAAVSVSIGEPGFYGSVDIGGGPPPAYINTQPVWGGAVVTGAEPMYLRVPPSHQRDWRRYCGRYNACDHPVHFVREDWYRERYAHRDHDRDDRYRR